MRNIRRVIRISVFVILGAWIHYVGPHQDVARIVNVDNRIMTISAWQRPFYAQEDSGADEDRSRDLRLISTERTRTWLFGLIRRGTQTMVYRNEDTGWLYPPYFKFDSSDLQAEAAASVSLTQPHEYVVITHYGWRIRWATIYPNAVAIRPAPGPDYHPFPWINLMIYAGLIGIALFVRSVWIRFRARTLEPLADRAGDRIDHVQAGMAERKGRIARWMDTWREKK